MTLSCTPRAWGLHIIVHFVAARPCALLCHHQPQALCAAEVERAEQMRQAAKSATASMFPWERRQMDGGKLTTFDRVYWIAFAGAIGFLIIVNGRRYFFPKKEVKVRKSNLHASGSVRLCSMACSGCFPGSLDVGWLKFLQP